MRQPASDAIDLVDQASRLDQPCRIQTTAGDHQSRPEDESIGAAVGLAPYHGAKLIVEGAHPDDLAQLEAEAVQQFAIGDRAPMAIALGKRGIQRSRRRQLHLAEQRICSIHRLQLHQLPIGAGRRTRHGAQCADGAHPAGGSEGLQRLGTRRAVEQAQFHIATQQSPGVARQPAAHRLGERAHAGDERHTQRKTEEEQPEAAQAPAQLAPGQAPDKRQPRR